MAEKHDDIPTDPQEVLRLLEDVRSRMRTAIWALHGMHQDLASLTTDDLADLEHLMGETVDQLLTPAYDAVTQMLGGVTPSGEVTTH